MIEIPDAQSHRAVADWLEIHLSIFAASISKAELSSYLEGLSGDESTEAFLSSVWNELLSRQSQYMRPPFIVSERRIIKNTAVTYGVEYLTCLILSLYGVNDHDISGRRMRSAKLFERLSGFALQEYLGGRFFLFGWPALDGTEPAIQARIQQVSTELNERFVEAPAATYKDRGVDIIAWKPFAEGRSCQCVILAQCAAGKDWRNKTTTLPMDAWTKYIHWASNPIKAFFVPCVIPDNLWLEASWEAGILFDRIRIMNLLNGGIPDEQLNQDLLTWTTEQLSEHEV
ncbi:MAG: hypothetical protein C4560_12790 [Nitrospiraceae bacterium]|nr:MAG: hypothetical protein C4560_12790 [Nitrospiraceae bacterium]